MRVAIVGAGVCGLVVARTLIDAGHDVTVLEKGRGVGGRLATRRREQGSFDHGAQRFSARSEAFRACVASWERDGVVQRTEPDAEVPERGTEARAACAREVPEGASRWWIPASSARPRRDRTEARAACAREVPERASRWWIPVPAATQLAKTLAVGIPVRVSARVMGLRRAQRAWWLSLEGAADEGPFAAVVITAPAPQAAQLLAPHHVFVEELARIRYEPTWALLLACDAAGVTWPRPIFTDVHGGPLSLIVREGEKPGRLRDDTLVRLVVHASSAFSLEHLEASEDDVAARMILALRAQPGLDAIRPRFVQAHRWRFARVAAPLGVPALFDRARGLGVAGDGLLGPRIEAAFESGQAMARALLAR